MLLELFIFLFIGILAGTITGLIPGIHINLISAFLVSISSLIINFTKPIYLGIFIVSMAITHTFIDFIPSIFLGCPDTDTELSILPGHELLKKGQGYSAIIFTTYGSLIAIFILALISIPSLTLIPKIYYLIKKIIPYILIAISLTLILFEKRKKSAFFVFLFSGGLGLIVLNLESLNQQLLPLLSGLFGSSMLILSIRNKPKIPKQKIEKIKIRNFKPILGAFIASPLCSFLPGLGSGQAAIIGNTITNQKEKDNKDFLLLLGITNTLVMGFSFLSLFAISRTRTGAAVAIKEIIETFNYSNFILIIITIVISGILSFFLTIKIAKFISKKVSKINYTKISFITLFLLTFIVIIVSGFLGFFVFLVSTLTGIYCISLKVRRTQMMGCLLIPTIILYLF